MNTGFVFPPPQTVPTARPPRPQKPGDAQASRDSNLLRASVLDVALELGIGSSSVVADWMFNNAVQEEDEIEVRMRFLRSLVIFWDYVGTSQHCGRLILKLSIQNFVLYNFHPLQSVRTIEMLTTYFSRTRCLSNIPSCPCIRIPKARNL